MNLQTYFYLGMATGVILLILTALTYIGAQMQGSSFALLQFLMGLGLVISTIVFMMNIRLLF